MPADNVLVLAVDGLRVSALGAYGNTTFPTPALDELAAESFLLDACFANAVELPLIYQSLWSGAHPLRGETTIPDHSPLPRWFSDRGYATTLITDEPEVASLSSAEAFDDCVRLSLETAERAADVSQTILAELFSTVCDQLEKSAMPTTRPRFVWVHSRGLHGPWDAPLELQEPLLAREEGDPEPSEDVEPPDFQVDLQRDPDAAFRCQCAYAAQVMALDECLAGLLDVIRNGSKHERWLVVLCGTRGFPLGEHGRVGGVDARLFAEQIHVPMLWRFADASGLLARDGNIASHLDVLPTLLDWLGDSDRASKTASYDGVSLLPRIVQFGAAASEAVVSASIGGARSIRNHEWSLRCDPARDDDVDGSNCELFVRPDDRWEANDVAGLCPEVVESLAAELQTFEESLASSEFA